jgi:hypothetical protein
MNKLHGFFQEKKRDNGETFFTLTDEAPRWLLEAVRDAHQGTIPNDWIWAECAAACEAIDSWGPKFEDDIVNYADSRVDVYTKELYQWAADFCLTTTWANAEEEATEIGFAVGETIGEFLGRIAEPGTPLKMEFIIRSVQYCAIRYIADVMVNAAKENS